MSEFLIVAQKVFEREKRPMSVMELVNLAYKERLFTDKIAGKTPHQTMKAKLSVDIRKKGDRSIFVRTKPGRFFLRHLVEGKQSVYHASPLHPPKTAEKVLVFPSAWLDKHERFQGIRKVWRKTAKELWDTEVFRYMTRLEAEEDNDHKQVLTYIMVTRGHRLLGFKRGTYNRVEDFLRGCHCVGFGGHVAELDRTLFNLREFGITNNAIRELIEEIKMPKRDKIRLSNTQELKIVGLLNDDSSAAGRRHFAFIFKYEVSRDRSWDSPLRGEKSITQLRWINPSSISLRDFEYWSQLCLRVYYPKLVSTQPSYLVRRKSPLKPPHVLCVLGTVGSGKSEATQVLKRDFGYWEVNSGQVLAKLLKVPPVPQTGRDEFQKLAWDFIKSPSGPKNLASAIWEEVRALSRDRVLIDGIRQRATLKELRNLSGPTRTGLLFVHTPPDIASNFYRKRFGEKSSINEFLKVREAPVEKEIEELIGVSDAVLYNWTGRPSYRRAIRELMHEVW